MTVSRLRHIPGIGVDQIGDAADATGNPRFLRLENLDTDVPPPPVARAATHAAVDADEANSYLPFQGHRALREAAAGHVSAMTGHHYDPGTECVGVAGGLNGILNVLLATVEPGQEVVICDPVYAGLVNRIRLAGAIPRHVRCVPGVGGWVTDPGELAAAIGPQTAAVLLMSPAMPTGRCWPASTSRPSPIRSATTAPGSSGTRPWSGSSSVTARPCTRAPTRACEPGPSRSARRRKSCA